MEYEIKDFRNEGGNKYIGFKVTDDKGRLFMIDKQIALSEGKTDEQYTQEAFSLCQTEIDEWQNSFINIGKKWNPNTNSFNA
tara:strand:- start:293 stop:538 length:246 start_codon:yes stop_codon:yes gene_type:complete